MKKIILSIFAILLTLTTVSAQNWQSSLSSAKELSTQENKPIILVFQGSDWCAPCIKLDKQIWSTDTFKTYAKEHFILLKADFPKRKKNALPPEQQSKNNKLAEKYNPNGYFPYVVILDCNGIVKGTTGYKKTTLEAYIKILESFKN